MPNHVTTLIKMKGITELPLFNIENGGGREALTLTKLYQCQKVLMLKTEE